MAQKTPLSQTCVRSVDIDRVRCIKYGLILFLACFASFSPTSKSVEVAKVLESIPKEDRESLEWLFRQFWESSYVLFGSKPMAFCCIHKVEPGSLQISEIYTFMDSITRFHSENLVRTKGWKAWKKYRHLFPSSRFSIIENISPNDTTIVMINKAAFFKQVEHNIDYFKEVLGFDITSEQVYDRCLQSKDVFKDALKNHDGLIGTLLGFGRNNAHLFSRKYAIQEARSKVPSPGFGSLEEEYESITAKLQFFDPIEARDFNPILLPMPAFVADNRSEETQQLRREYSQQYKNIIALHRKGDFLTTTLRQFCH